MKKEKTIFILKKENIFPEVGMFKKINEVIWKNILKKVVKRIKKEKDCLVISDFYYELKKEGIESKKFIDYIEINPRRLAFRPYYEYIDAKRFSEKFFSLKRIKEFTNYKKYNLTEVIQEWFNYSIIEILQEITLIGEIINKEKPNKIVYLNKESFFSKTIRLFCEKKEINSSHIISFFSSLNKEINLFIKKFDILIRTIQIPGIKRREFAKTNHTYKGEKIIFCAFNDFYLERFGKILEYFPKNKLVVMCTDVRTQKILDKKGLHYVSFGNFLDRRMRKEIKKEWKNKIKTLKKQEENESLIYNGINLFEIFKKNLEQLLLDNALSSGYYLSSLEELIRKGAKNFILLDNATLQNRSIAKVAKEKGAKSICLQNGIYADPTGRGILPILSDKIAIWGEEAKRYDKQIKEKGIITGNVKFDMYPKGEGSRKKEYFILATQSFDGISSIKEIDLMVRQSISAMRKFPKKKLLIKIHPRGKIQDILDIIKETKSKNIFLEKENPTEELIKDCEALITTNSTLMLDAMILKKPIITLNPINRKDVLECVKKGVSVEAKDEKELINAIDKIQDKEFVKELYKKSTKFLRDYCYKIDGKASERVSKLINDLMKNE